MARFTETDEAAQLLQQILSMSTAARPPHPGSAPAPPAYWDERATDDAPSGDESITMTFVTEPDPPSPAGPAPDMPPPPAFPGTVIRELVTTHAGQVQLTLHASPQHAPNLPDGRAGSDGETVAEFFRRVVRPLPNTDLSAT
jgi:hypothetical protein